MHFRNTAHCALALCLSVMLVACGDDPVPSDNNGGLENNTTSATSNNGMTGETSDNNNPTSANNTTPPNNSTSSNNPTSTGGTTGDEECMDGEIEIPSDVNQGDVMIPQGCYASCDPSAAMPSCPVDVPVCLNTSVGGICVTNEMAGGPVCGDGIVEDDEICDGDCPQSPVDCTDDGNACTTSRVMGLACQRECVNEPVTTCQNDDGCCPMGCTDANDNDCEPVMMDPATGVACKAGDCGSGMCITEAQDFPGGYCSAACNSSADCTGDGVCVPINQNMQLCLDACTGPNDCRMGYECANVGMGLSLCLPEEQRPPGDTGAACVDDMACNTAEGEGCITAAEGWSGGYCTRNCQADADCPSGSHCDVTDPVNQAGFCVVDCQTDADCRMSYECSDAFGTGIDGCFPIPTGTGAPGAACTNALNDCGGGRDGFCLGTNSGFDGGYCSLECTTDADCGAGAHCTTVQGQSGPFSLCTPDCTANSDCRNSNYVCGDVDSDATNECWPGGGGAGTPGDACTAIGDCGGGLDAFCIGSNQPQTDWQGGYCTNSCTTDADCTAVDANSHCGFIDNGSGVCIKNCTADTDCRTGYGCFNADRDANSVAECAPAGTGSAAIGGACSVVQDCAGGNGAGCLVELDDGMGGTITVPGGYCTFSPCTANGGECGAGAHCSFIDPQTGNGACLQDCTTVNDCRSGFSCVDADQDATTECFL